MRPDRPTIENRDELAGYVGRYDDKIDGKLGVFLGFPIEEGDFDVLYAHNETRVFQSASTIKLPVLYALYERYDGELGELDQPCPFAPENRVGGSGLLHLLDATPTFEDLAVAMISASDNAATNQLIDHLGIEAVNDAADGLGMERTRLARKMMATLEDTEFEGFDVHVPEDEPTNATTPLDCVRFFADLVGQNTLTGEAYERLRVPLEAQKDTSTIPRYLPYEIDIAHKTGWLPTAALDTGILSVPDRERPLVFSVFIDGVGSVDGQADGRADSRQTGADAADAIAEIGDAVFAYLR